MTRMNTRFERTPIKYKWITPRDLEIVRFVYNARYATKNQVRDVLFSPTTDSSAKRRLRLLFVKGYLKKRPARSIEPDVYYLGLKGKRYMTTLGADRELIDKLTGISGVGGMHLTHDLMITDVLVALHQQCRRWGMVYQWANTRLTKEYLKHLRVEPDAWFSIERNGKVKETYVEVTAVLPTAEEMRLKLANYKALMSGTVLWFATSLSKVNWIRRKVAEHGMGDRVLVGLFEDRRNFLTDPIWWHMDSETPVGWVKIAQPRVSIEDMTPGGDTLIYDERT